MDCERNSGQLSRGLKDKFKEIVSVLNNEDGMLILVRKVQQSFWIEGDIIIKVLSIERDKVKLGITTPVDTRVMRSELLVELPDSKPEPKQP